jgi:hypothetical protein
VTERVQCKTPGCTRDILPSTAADTGGFCMPCVQQKQRDERKEFIRQNRRDVDPFAGLADLVEIIKTFHQDRPHDPLTQYLPYKESLEGVYLSLTVRDQQRLADEILRLFQASQTKLAQNLLLELSAFTTPDITEVLRWQAANEDPYHHLPYRLSDAATRNMLLGRIAQGAGDLSLNHILSALAWIGDAEVVNQFARWRASPPPWKKSLHVQPENYSRQAGWELTPEGGRRNLFVSPAFALVPPAGRASSNVVQMGQRLASSCGWCRQPLTVLLDFDRSDSRLQFLPWSLSRLRIGTCIGCTCYGPVYCGVDDAGTPLWSDHNRKPDYLPDDPSDWSPMPVNPFMLARSTRAAHHSANQFLPTTFSLVGGLPTWIQDEEYPGCPGCRRTMSFIAQICNDELPGIREGTYYAFLCSDCRLTATGYQQT